MDKKVKEITTSKLAERYGVGHSTARGWCTAGLFPNARQEDTPRGAVWMIPEGDLEGFIPPRRGPKSSKQALVKALA